MRQAVQQPSPIDPESEVIVMDSQAGNRVVKRGKYKDIQHIRNWIDKKDTEYGAVRYHYQILFNRGDNIKGVHTNEQLYTQE